MGVGGELFWLGGDQWGPVGVSGGRWGWEHGLVKPIHNTYT